METYAQLIGYTDERIIEIIDAQAPSVTPGVRWYLDELVRRRQDRATEALVDLTKRLRRLTIVLVLLTLLGTAAAVYAAIKAG